MGVDVDILRWFKKMRPRYQTRMKQVLRVYYTAMVQGLLNTHFAKNEENALACQYFEEVMKQSWEEGCLHRFLVSYVRVIQPLSGTVQGFHTVRMQQGLIDFIAGGDFAFCIDIHHGDIVDQPF